MTASTTQTPQASPLLLPPKPPSAVSQEPNLVKNDNVESSDNSEANLDSQKEKVLSVLAKCIGELSAAVQSSVSIKLKTLNDDWSQCDPEIKKLLVELSQYLETADSKNAALSHRKIIMKGCSKSWVHAIRQIIMNLETISSSADSQPEEILPENDE